MKDRAEAQDRAGSGDAAPALDPRARAARVELLRAQLEARFRDAHRPAPSPDGRERPLPLGSGFRSVDASLRGGGLAAGETALVEAAPGSGGLALASSWARVAAAAGEPVLVVDAHGTSSALAWVEPPSARAPIWIVRPRAPAEAWPALDIALRSGGFGLVVLLDPTRPPQGAGPRLLRLARERQTRLVLVGAAPFRPDATIRLRPGAIVWDEAPVGAAPAHRALLVQRARAARPRSGDATREDRGDERAAAGDGAGAGARRSPCVEERREDMRCDRLRPPPGAPDRRPPSGREGAAAREAGRSGREPRPAGAPTRPPTPGAR